MRRIGLILALVLALALLSGAAMARPTVPLNGTWEAATGDLASPPAESAVWAPAAVPGVVAWKPQGPAAIWYRRSVEVPASWSGQHVIMRVDGAKYGQRVFVNGKLAGSHTGGFEPAEYDVTAQVVTGKKNQLLIGVGDWTSLLAEGSKPGDPTPGQPTGSWIKQGLLAPVGVAGDETGIRGSVVLEARPRLWVAEARVEPQVQERLLRVVVTVKNDGVVEEQVAVTGRIAEGGPAPRLTPVRVTVPPGKTQTVTLQAPWPQVRLWTPQDPHLYSLIAAVSTGAIVDAQQVTFGFRDFRVEGDHFLLNGVPTRLLSIDASHAPRVAHTPEAILTAARAAGANSVCLLGEPWPESWYDAADRTGLLVIADTALGSMAPSYALSRDAFWVNARDHVSATVRRLCHHPSVVMWNAESDLLASGGAAEKGAEQKVGELVALVHQLDPTRPVMCRGDADPAGKADVISRSGLLGLDQWTELPDASFRQPAAKPLQVDGPAMLPASGARTATAVLGDAAYPDAQRARLVAEGAARTEQVIAARDAGVAVLCGWDLDPVTGAVRAPEQQTDYSPVAAFDLSANAEVFAGSVVSRRVSVLNDSAAPHDLVVRWRLVPANEKWQVAGETPLSLLAGGRERLDVDLPLRPITAEVVPAAFDLEVWEGDHCLFATTAHWNIHSRAHLSGPVPGAPKHIAVFDPDGETMRLLAEMDLQPAQITEQDAPHATSAADLVIIGKGALRDPLCPTGSAVSQAVLAYAQRGGTVLVFEQTEYPQWLAPLSLVARRAALAFPRLRDYPALRGLDSWDLGYWAPDGIVSRSEIRKPDQVGFLPVLDSGGPEGLETAALAEWRVGRGRLVLCQLDVTDRYGADPAATRLVRNLIVTGKVAPSRRAAALVDDAAAAQLDAVGLRYDRLTDLRRASLVHCQVLIVSDLARAQQEARLLQEYVAEGGQVVLHGVTPATADAVAHLVGHPLAVQETDSGATRLADRSGPAAALSNEEFAWLLAGPQGPLPVVTPAVAGHTIAMPPGEGAVLHTDPGVLLSLPAGRGRWILDQVRWDQPGGHELEARRYLSMLLTALNCEPATQ